MLKVSNKVNYQSSNYSINFVYVKGQTGEADVSVYVKPPRNQAPIANAGKNQTINLPKNWVILDGSESKDDQNITFWEWTQLQGPNNAGNILIS